VRILHTSDWHLGRSFHGQPMLAHQAAFVDHLLEVVAAEEVDLVVVSGDVYDRALPPVDAVALAEDALVRLAASRARVVLTSGNHDSHQRLGFASRLIDAAGVHVRTHARDVGAPVLLEDRHGPVAVYGLPYLDPDHLREPWDLPGRSHEAALGEALRRVRADLATRPPDTRSVVLAHAFVAGAEPSDSERDISVGGVQAVPTALFDGFCYTALGHLHGRHRLTDTVRYSGSPLAYSFSEAAHRKGSWLVELDAEGTARAEQVPAPAGRRLSVLRGRLADLTGSAAYTRYEDDFLSVTLTDPVRPEGAMDALRARFPHVLVLAFEPEGAQRDAGGYRARVAGRDDESIAAEFVRHVSGAPPTPAEQELLTEAFEAVRAAETD
jgi:exonuclease SbcD